MAGKRIDAIAYLRTSSAANVGSDKDSDKRQRAAIASFAKAHGYRIVDEFYDAAVSGADPVAERPGFKAMLDRIAGNGVRVILVESPDRFARDLSVQITGHDYLRSLGVELVPTSSKAPPDETIAPPPALTIVPTAVPPDAAISLPPLDTVAPTSMPPADTTAVPPLPRSGIRSASRHCTRDISTRSMPSSPGGPPIARRPRT